MRLTEAFYRRKVGQVQGVLAERGLDGLVLMDYNQIYYLLGFFHYPSERPLLGFVPQAGEPTLFIPRVEADQVAEAWVKDVEVYSEYPGVDHPLEWVGKILAGRGLPRARLGFEGSTSIAAMSRLKAGLPDAEWVESGDILARLRIRKDPEEITLIRAASRYADFMLDEGVRYVRETGLGATEVEVNNHVNKMVADLMLQELNEVVFVTGVSGGLVCSGPRSAYAHGLPTKRRWGRGENLILSFACTVGGYHAESERVFFLGEPTEQQARHFETVRAAQEAGTAAVKPGVPCREPNRVCYDIVRRAGFGDYVKHRMGHGIGIQNHEPPWIEEGDRTPLEAGMVISSEPGLYVPGLGGYRISDTVLVTETGAERLTKYPRTLESAILDF